MPIIYGSVKSNHTRLFPGRTTRSAQGQKSDRWLRNIEFDNCIVLMRF